MKYLCGRLDEFTSEVHAMVQTVCCSKFDAGDFPSILRSVAVLPSVVEWMQRSAHRRRGTGGLALGSAHFPEDWVHAEVTSGWPSETGSVSQKKVDELRAAVAPYADRVLRMDTLLPYQASREAPEDAPLEERDLPADRPLAAALAGTLTTIPVKQWLPAYRSQGALVELEASSEAPPGPVIGNFVFWVDIIELVAQFVSNIFVLLSILHVCLLAMASLASRYATPKVVL